MGRQHRTGRSSGRGRGCAAITAGLVLVLAIGSKASEDWVADLNEGMQRAGASGKDLLVNFTGTEWCGPCEELERDVLDRPSFLEAARRAFVLVELDYPASDEDLPDGIRDDFIAWRERYGIHAFPTVILADAEGMPYAITGNIGVGPGEYVRHLETLKAIRAERDAAFDEAAESRGSERAGHLDEALSALRSGFGGPVAENRDGALVQFYRRQVEEVLAIAEAEGLDELASRYERVLHSDREQRRVAALYDRLQEIEDSEGLVAAIEAVDRAIEASESTGLRNQLRGTRLIYLGWSDRNAEALAYAEELSRDGSYSAEERRWFRERMAFNLKQLDRIDEAAAVFDELIAEAEADARTATAAERRAMADYHDWKATYLVMAGRTRDALETRDAARQYIDRGTSGWMDNECKQADLLSELSRIDEAVAVLDGVADCEGFDALDRAGLLAETALLLGRDGRGNEAIARADRAEVALSQFEPDHGDLPYVEIIRGKIEAARGEGP